ncbi:hypothetical protein ACFL4Z_02405 [candidate division KSB1 bacterium]
MLNRIVIKEFLEEELKEREIKIPENISEDVLVESFCKYVEDDYYEWLNDNFKSFFNRGDTDWEWIKERIERYSKD